MHARLCGLGSRTAITVHTYIYMQYIFITHTHTHQNTHTQVGKSDPFVTLSLRTARARGITSPRRTKNLDKKLPRMALKAQQTSYQTQSRPGELNPVHPQFDEEFSFLIYDLGQELVAVLYDQVFRPVKISVCFI